MTNTFSRRQMLGLVAGGAASVLTSPVAAHERWLQAGHGVVVGQDEASEVGQQVIADGGNAVDGIVAAALAAGVTALPLTGIGGYGGHMVIALRGQPVTAIDFNSTAPAAARPGMFNADATGRVADRSNFVGWLAAGVPGTLAGLQLALTRFGTWPLGRALTPAIRLAEEGFVLGTRAGSIRRSADDFRRDPGSAALFLPGGEPPSPEDLHRNPDLARMLRTLADDNSVEGFYRGDIGRQIASAFQANGGLVTEADMASYRAREVEPLSIEWLGHTIHTAPLTAGGATIIETLSILKALDATGKQLGSAHARVEALRVAWSDRLRFFGDPTQADVPVDRLLSAAYAEAMAARVAEAVEQRKPLDISTDATPQDGTVNLSAADDDGNFATVTFTHGGSFGAKVTVPGLGLTLGHGVSRFDPRAWHPNSPGPSKRPLHNMCPTVVVHDGRAWLAVGGAGGRRIPNGVFDVLTGVLMGRSVEQAVAAPRMNTTGDLDLRLEEAWPADDVEAFRGMGYAVQTGGGARISAAFGDPASGALATARR